MCYYNRERTLECTAFNCARALPYTEQSAISTIAQCSPMTTEPNKCVENLQPFATQSGSLHLNSERRCHPLCNGCDGNQTNYGQTPSPLVPRPSHPVGEFGCLLYGVFLLGSLRTCMFWEGTVSSFPRTVKKNKTKKLPSLCRSWAIKDREVSVHDLMAPERGLLDRWGNPGEALALGTVAVAWAPLLCCFLQYWVAESPELISSLFGQISGVRKKKKKKESL